MGGGRDQQIVPGAAQSWQGDREQLSKAGCCLQERLRMEQTETLFFMKIIGS